MTRGNSGNIYKKEGEPGISVPEEAMHHEGAGGRVFVRPSPVGIHLGEVALKEHLEAMGLNKPLVVREILQSQDWSEFESDYARSGRAPYGPEVMSGLILYGILNGVTSLRGLERFARSDLGCMWVTGGIYPDHAIIGRFIDRHDERLSKGLFETVTSTVLARTGGGGKQLAGDGTVLEAACSHYKLLRWEAVQKYHAAARARLEQSPDDAEVQAQAAHAQEVLETMQARREKKQSKGKKVDNDCISVTEPEAVMQPQKRGRGRAASYKPSVLANSQRVITAHTVHPSCETAVLPELVAQSAAVTGTMVEDALFDAGYFCDAVINLSLDRDINLLCPESHQAGKPKSSSKYYPKSMFHYDEATNSYSCPAGQILIPISRYRGKGDAPAYVLYASEACLECPQRAQCTRAKRGRRVKRYAGDEAKDALRQVMQHKAAKYLFSKRQAWVEPVFSVLRGRQNLNRFQRKGLARVKTEFALHVIAYNLARAVACVFFAPFTLLSALHRAFNFILGLFFALLPDWLTSNWGTYGSSLRPS